MVSQRFPVHSVQMLQNWCFELARLQENSKLDPNLLEAIGMVGVA